MISCKTIQKDVNEIISITCDCCGVEYKDDMDWQEFLRINDIGGYKSAIGDEVHFKCDLCSKCVVKLLGDYLSIVKINYWDVV
jgi:hypothetical protein